MQPCQLPPPLQPGDSLWVILPSGALREHDRFNQGVDLWRSQGYRVVLSAEYDQRWGYLAGTDAQRRAALDQGLRQPDIRGILCGRGGYGGTRLLEQWQWPPQDPPKWILGFSDVTSLLWSYACQGLAGVHGPVLTTLGQEPDWALHRLWTLLAGRPLPPLTGLGWGGGIAEGLLLPCNLTVATHLLGTPWMPDLSNVILALEDVGEAPYRIDRMLTHWRTSGRLQQVRGIALGRFSRCEAPEGIASFTVESVLRDRLADLGIPVVSDLPFGHDGVNAVLPVGQRARLDGNHGTLEVLT
ncbi:S66 peptidase family protein [Lyngbya confervoides]|uniref:LD-carboxypeptidase n=1 Tax=Lyngbya confervoides BDU141951 TaxID=1574623 RepID=A0ABD4T6P1_9CYAN|nr:LD-carboxypeptidase [Lyngbya confervoides]MCM1984131.1 LD-carboxypeptidase [Lyngbya confervoides BDU141951]